MNYLNKALDTFSTNVVSPMYYVGFSTATILASLILFQGFNSTSGTNTFSLFTGFVVTFLGVHLLNFSRSDAEDTPPPSGEEPPLNEDSAHAVMNPRQSMNRLSADGGWPASPHAFGADGVPGHARRGSLRSISSVGGGSTALFRAHEVGADGPVIALARLGEEDEEEDTEDSDERSRLNPSKRDRPRNGERDLDLGVGRTLGSGSGERIAP